MRLNHLGHVNGAGPTRCMYCGEPFPIKGADTMTQGHHAAVWVGNQLVCDNGFCEDAVRDRPPEVMKRRAH